MIKRSMRIIMTLVIPLMLVAATVLLMLLLSAKTSKRARELTNETLQTIGKQQRDLLDAKLRGEFAVLDVVAGVVESAEERHTQQMLEHIVAATKHSDFVDVYVLDKDGYGFTTTDEDVYFGDCKYFQETLNGNHTISRVNPSRIGEDEAGFVLMAPIRSNGEITGVVSGLLATNGISELLHIEYYADSESFISDSDGNIIAGSESLNVLLHKDDLFSVFSNAEFDEPYNALDTVKDIHAQREGFVSYSIDGEHWYLSYLPIDVNDWSICTAIPGEFVDAALSTELSDGYVIIGAAMASASLLILFVILLYAGANKRARKERELLLIAREEYRISAQQSGAMILRYDIRSQRLVPNEIMMERYKLPKATLDNGDVELLEGMIAEESMTEYREFWTAIQNGEPNGRIECRMKNPDGEFGWFSFEFTAIHDEKGTVYRPFSLCKTLRDSTRKRQPTNAGIS